ncbi:MAG TPA: flavodoxin domain-containing protein [Gaiellaceae bacterium]|nr:flavodoxin domain-containing protein [Gaiellaceae bacterium]
MQERILVAYATKHGSTREVAERIGELTGGDVRSARAVDSLERYGAVVLGGALYMSRWHKDAHRFLKRFESELGERPLAVFALGPIGQEPVDATQARGQLDKALADHPAVRPVAVEIFGGRIDPTQLRFPFSRLEAADSRDWDAIERWAAELPQLLRPRLPVPV